MQQDYVTKRDGSLQKIDLGKVQTRITNLHLGRINIDGNLIMLPQLQNTNPVMIAQAVIGGIKNKITTSELDQLALETAAGCIVKHNEYDTLATRLGMSDLHKSTPSTLLECAKELWNTHDSRGRHKPLISEEVWNVIQNNHIFLESLIDYSRDYNYKFFGLQTLKKIYLLKKNDVIVERPQHMIMRVSIGLYGDDFEAIKENYELMSKHYFTHATPTIFNCGTPKPTLISCFLLQIPDDSIEGIYEAVKKFAIISAGSGGIGFHQHDLRAAFSQIYGSNGKTDSIIKFLRVLNEETVHVNQGGRRPASFASYLEFWHDDIIEWIQAKRQTGDEKNRSRRLFYGGWIPDLFMERVASGGKWSLMSPDDCPGLSDCYGAEFKKKYEKYESEGKFRRQVSAREIFDELITTELESGMPYICFKDHVNHKSNQKNIGVIKSSNLCSEVTLVSTPEETACCVLASVALPQFVSNDLKFDYPMLEKVVTRIVKGLNKVIDVNRYMTKCAEQSNMRHRPLGIGVQGLADLFYMYRTTYGEPLAKQLNKDIFEAIYYYAMKASMELAKIDGPYSTFEGSPTSRGEFQFDLWGVSPSDRYDWNQLKRDVARYGIRNSTLIALMPTASTSQLLGNSECIEPYSSNIFARSTLAGIFQVVNQYLMNDLTKLGLWNEEMCQAIIANNGSIQSVEGIPDDIKWLYRTAWELEMKDILDMSADRGAYVCQSQSLNLFKEIPKGEDSMTGMRERLRRMYFYAWKLGLKTGQYYLRTRPAKDPIKVTVQVKKMIKLANGGTVECTDEVCTMCDG